MDQPPGKLELPAADQGCDEARFGGETTTIPIKVDRVDGAVVILANICIAGTGPYPLIVDTGAPITTLSSTLAEKLKLKKIGEPAVLRGLGCTNSTQEIEMPAWSLDGVPLAAQAAFATRLPGQGGLGEPQGLIGADVLSSFGAIRIDYRHETLTVVGHEGGYFDSRQFAAPDGSGLPAAVVRAKPQIYAPMIIVNHHGEVRARIRVALGAGLPRGWIVDTGSSVSSVDSSLAKEADLRPTGNRRKLLNFCTLASLPEFASSSWTLSGRSIEPRPFVVQTLASVGAAGLFGSDVMSRYGSVVLDWAGGRLLLGVG